ncbi:MAG TPA: DUF5615 family PIN-like protein [Kiritimatiellia bacterium]|nr:DUF5615 family PIN-like protein [Kiritimatiellia bacterium]
MRGILLDENLPSGIRLPTNLSSVSVRDLDSSLSDSDVWLTAKEQKLVIVTKDADFRYRILQSNPPPWIVHIRLGNLRLRAFADKLIEVWPCIQSMLPDHKLITVFNDRIEGIE